MASTTQDIDILSKFADYWQYSAIFLAILVAIFTFLSYVYSQRAQSAKDVKIAQVQAGAAIDVAKANARSEEAQKGAAEANARSEEARRGAAEAHAQSEEARKGAVEANERTQKAMVAQESLKQDSIKLETRLNAAISEAASSKVELVNAQQRLADTQRKLAVAQQQEEEARLALQQNLEAVRRNQLPRTVTAVQRTHLIDLLKQYPGGIVELQSPLGDAESSTYARELSDALTSAGWKTVTTNVAAVIYPNSVPQHGLIMEVHDGKAASPYAFVFLNWLRSIRANPQVQFNPDMHEDVILLVVGIKSPSTNMP